MIKHFLAVHGSIFLLGFWVSGASAMPADELVQELGNSVLRVHVNLPDGKHGLGSAVVIAKGEVITNCHVVNDATDITVIHKGEPYVVTAIKPDWHHDLCMLKVESLDAPVVKMGSTKNLHYEESVFTVGYPGETTQPVTTYGEVKGLFPMDGSMVMRATSTFRLGASGGGAFDDSGNLVGIITLKSKGSQAHYYYMPVEWVKTLMNKPAQTLGVKSEKPFWALASENRPYFMQVVQPYVNQDWKSLLKVAQQWVQAEPDTPESWFYLAAAEYAAKDFDKASVHLNQVLALNHEHRLAGDYLAKIMEMTGKSANASQRVALLN
ncbi:MAG TPA: trypsin-like peptidase domain-containing protein [Methylophilus sp.]|nr:trypsin-like peptidase domain-containing protein [Methylophilus sp.]HQQ32790.1 trypsin-like peptidase domain-containing protein [Methylophilus sp.]